MPKHCAHRSRLLRAVAVPTVIAALTLLTAACAVNPATGERQLILMSEAQEIELGRQYDQQVVAQMGLYDDPAWQDYIQQLGSRLAARSERPNLPWTFRVVDDPVVNAFALPGGFIYITRGILAHFKSEAQLTAVLGHEIGHVTARHSASQASRAQLAQLGLVMGVALRPELADYAGLASTGIGLLFLKFGRDDERQADDLGLRYMRRAGFDAREMPEVFTMLDLVSQASGGGSTPEWLSTHPNPENRRERIEAAIAQLPPDSLGTVVNGDSYLHRLDGLVFADNPRDGFFRGEAFFHPNLAFRLDFPTGWTTLNRRDAVIGISADENAVLQLTVAGEGGPDASAREFFSAEGVTGSGVPTRVNGLSAVRGDFSATVENGTLRGHVAFVQYGGNVFRLLGYSEAGGWSSYAAAARAFAGSFRELTDPRILGVQPYRLSIVSLDRSLSLTQFLARYPAPVDPQVVALVNQLGSGVRFAPGLAKRVVGQALR